MIEHLILTGANGYIGTHLVALARAQGRHVTALGRRPVEGARHVPWALGEPLPPAALLPDVPPAAQAAIHLAHDWRNRTAPGTGESGVNLAGAQVLFASCRAAGLGRIVFVSSQSARADAANIYGRVKYRIEQTLRGPGEIAARVGLVYGGPTLAMYGLLATLTRIAPILPMIDPWRPVQPIHLDEVCRGLLLLADADPDDAALQRWAGLAGPSGVPFGDVLRGLAAGLHGRRLRVLPVPLGLVLLGCRVLEAVPIGPKLDRERVLGLAGTRPMDCATHLAALGLAVAPFPDRLPLEPAARRTVLREGRTLLRYVLRRPPGRALLRRYARAVSLHDPTGPIPLPGLVHAAPRLLRLIEPLRRDGRLGRRLGWALALAEASPEGEAALAHGSRPARLAALALDLAIEAVALPIRLLAGRQR